MSRYILIDPATGERKSLSETNLTLNLRLNRILFRGDEHLGIITHRDLVFFTWWCAGKILTQVKGAPDQRVTSTLALVHRWVEDEKSVTSEELAAAADAAWAALPAARAVATDAAAAAAWTTARAAWAAAADGAWTSHDAAWTAAETSQATQAVSYEAQVQWLVEHLQSGK